MIKPAIVLIVLLASIANAGTLQTSHSRHYTIHSDLPVAMVDDLGAQLDAIYDEYGRRLADYRPKGEVKRLEVYLFAKRDDYSKHLGGAGANTRGVFVPSFNFLAAYHEGVRREDLRSTLRHEAFHQFAYNRIGALPVWLNEGLAQVFQDGYWFGNTFRLGEVDPARYAALQEAIKQRRLVDFRTMLSMTLPQWNSRNADPDAGSAQYAQAWAMAHMLIFATEGSGEPHYRPHLLEMLRLINVGVSGDIAFRRAFSDNIDGFQQRFLVYAGTLRPDDLAAYRYKQRMLAETMIIARTNGFRYATVSDLRQQLLSRMEALQWPYEQRTAVDDCFRFTTGPAMPAHALSLARNPVGHVPDIICKPGGGFVIRTRFHALPGDQLDYDLLVEPEQ